MICSNCGFQNDPGDMFCKQCGTSLTNASPQPQMAPQQPVQQPQQPQMVNQPMSQPVGQPIPMNNNVYQQPVNPQAYNNYANNGVVPNMTKWSILSIVIPSIALVIYWFIGLPAFVAIAISAIGFSFAKKGAVSNKTLSIIGYVVNGILLAFSILMMILIATGNI